MNPGSSITPHQPIQYNHNAALEVDPQLRVNEAPAMFKQRQ